MTLNSLATIWQPHLTAIDSLINDHPRKLYMVILLPEFTNLGFIQVKHKLLSHSLSSLTIREMLSAYITTGFIVGN